MRGFRVFCLAASWLLAMTVAPAAEPELVEQALRTLDSSDTERWEFVETVENNGKTFVQRHDPGRPEGDRWTLVSVDGREPTDAERTEHTNGKPEEEAEKEKKDGNSEDGEIRAMITPDSLSLIEETPTHLVYRFDPAGDNEEDARLFEHVEGTLRISRDGPRVETVEMRSHEPFSPAFGVKIRQFSTVMTFAPVGESGEVLPLTVSVRIAGRAMLIKKIDETVEVRYSDYRLPGGS